VGPCGGHRGGHAHGRVALVELVRELLDLAVLLRERLVVELDARAQRSQVENGHGSPPSWCQGAGGARVRREQAPDPGPQPPPRPRAHERGVVDVDAAVLQVRLDEAPQVEQAAPGHPFAGGFDPRLLLRRDLVPLEEARDRVVLAAPVLVDVDGSGRVRAFPSGAAQYARAACSPATTHRYAVKPARLRTSTDTPSVSISSCTGPSASCSSVDAPSSS